MRRGPLTFAVCLVALGALTLVVGDFALQWQPVPTWVPARGLLAYISGLVLLGTGVGVGAPKFAKTASAVLLVYLTLWFVLLKLIPTIGAAGIEANWLGAGEIAVIWLAGVALFDAERAAAKRGKTPADRLQWTATIISAMIGAAAWVIAESLRPVDRGAGIRAPDDVSVFANARSSIGSGRPS